jgi:hypothetical protein
MGQELSSRGRSHPGLRPLANLSLRVSRLLPAVSSKPDAAAAPWALERKLLRCRCFRGGGTRSASRPWEGRERARCLPTAGDQLTIALHCFRYFAGVNPVWLVNNRVKWLCEQNPRSSATRASGAELFRSNSNALISRRRLTNRSRLNPSVRRNFLAQWLGGRASRSLDESTSRRLLLQSRSRACGPSHEPHASLSSSGASRTRNQTTHDAACSTDAVRAKPLSKLPNFHRRCLMLAFCYGVVRFVVAPLVRGLAATGLHRGVRVIVS